MAPVQKFKDLIKSGRQNRNIKWRISKEREREEERVSSYEKNKDEKNLTGKTSQLSNTCENFTNGNVNNTNNKKQYNIIYED